MGKSLLHASGLPDVAAAAAPGHPLVPVHRSGGEPLARPCPRSSARRQAAPRGNPAAAALAPRLLASALHVSALPFASLVWEAAVSSGCPGLAESAPTNIWFPSSLGCCNLKPPGAQGLYL